MREVKLKNMLFCNSQLTVHGPVRVNQWAGPYVARGRKMPKSDVEQ